MQMISALYRYPKSMRSEVAQTWGERSGLAHHRIRDRKGVDAETRQARHRHDAKGQIVREGATYHGDGRVTLWCVRRSLRGSVDQFDFVANGVIKLTAGPRRFPLRIRPL